MMLRCHILFISLKRQNTQEECNTMKKVKNMKVKIFDCEHEKDLESAVNSFLNSGNYDILTLSIAYQHLYLAKNKYIVTQRW